MPSLWTRIKNLIQWVHPPVAYAVCRFCLCVTIEGDRAAHLRLCRLVALPPAGGIIARLGNRANMPTACVHNRTLDLYCPLCAASGEPGRQMFAAPKDRKPNDPPDPGQEDAPFHWQACPLHTPPRPDTCSTCAGETNG